MRRRPVYIVLAGLCGSGKSTLRKEIVSSWDGYLNQLSTDDLIDWYAQSEGKTYSEVFLEHIEQATASTRQDRLHFIARGADIVHDQTNVTTSKRKSLISDLSPDYLKVCIHVHTDAMTRQKRLGSRPGKIIPPHVDASMVNSWQQPVLCEGFDVVIPAGLWRPVLRPYLVN